MFPWRGKCASIPVSLPRFCGAAKNGFVMPFASALAQNTVVYFYNAKTLKRGSTMKKAIGFLVFAAFSAASVAGADPTHLGSYDLDVQVEGESVPDNLYLYLGYGSCDGGAGSSVIGCDKSWVPGETGTYDFNSSNSANFDAIASMLTDGSDDTIMAGYQYTPQGLSGAQGSSDLQPSFTNSTITMIRLLVTSNESTGTGPVVEVQDAGPVALLRTAVPAQDASLVASNAGWEGSVSAEWQVWGTNSGGGGGNQVPEISAAGLPVALGFLLTLLAWRAERRNRQMMG